MGRNFRCLLFLALVAVISLTAAVYWPGLHGDFLFDDFGNLPALGATGPVNHWPAFWRFITSGIADPIGRPLTQLSFLLDAHDWPAPPHPFKRTNLALHLLNGALLFILLSRLGERLQYDARRVRVAALVGCALWLLHPLLVSTTLYIVQREAMLPATFTITGLLLWLHGRKLLSEDRILSGTTWSVLGLGLFTLLGTLAKANGALLPMYALVIELIIVRPRQPLVTTRARRMYRAIATIFVALPSVAILAYLLWVGIHGVLASGPVEGRSWSLGQRLLTEPRVLMEYLQLLWLPRPFSSGLFNDQYMASTSWWHPVTTLPAVLAILGLLSAAWYLRKKYPAISLALLFYLAGQLLESTSIPLELYFEHRNYLPAMLMFWPLGLWLSNFRSLGLLKVLLILALPLLLACMTYIRAELWGDVRGQALLWARINPDSPRAQANAASIEMQNRHAAEAAKRLEYWAAKKPEEVQLAVNLITAHCLTGGLHAGDLQAVHYAMQHTYNPGSLLTHWFERMIPLAISKECAGLDEDGLLDMIDGGMSNPRLAAPGPQQDLIYLRARIAMAQHKPDEALADFKRALDLQVRPGMALNEAATLGAAGYAACGLQLLDHYQQVRNIEKTPGFGMPKLHAWILARQNYWPQEQDRLRRQLMLDANAANLHTCGPSPHPDRKQIQ